jgi:hypothetical protein
MNIAQDAELYATRKQFSVFPLHGITEDLKCACGNPNCSSPGKHPTTSNGVKAATRDVPAINSMFKVGDNLGVATGEVSGFWALDIDGQGGEISFGTLIAEHGPLSPTLIHFTGNGRHILFKHPGYRIKNSVKKLGPGLDVRGDGGYIVFAPSMHWTGTEYYLLNPHQKIGDAPDWLLDAVRYDQPQPDLPVNAIHDIPLGFEQTKLTQDDVLTMLSFIHPDLDYEDWVYIGMGLHAGGYSLQTWDTWSRGGAKYEAGCCAKRWKGFKPGGATTFGTVWHFAEQNGWSPDLIHRDEKSSEDGAASELVKNILKAQNPQETATKKSTPTEAQLPASIPSPVTPFPVDPLAISGLIGDTIRWIVRCAIRKQPELALLNTLAALGAITGRTYKSPWNTRTNIYMVGLAGTGSGKDHSRKCIKALLEAADLTAVLGGDDTPSAQGLLAGLASHPGQILHLDEFGKMLAAIGDERAPQYKRAIAKTITEMFTTAGSIYHGGYYAGTDRKPVIVSCPALSIYGTSTVETYRDAITRAGIANGELNRYLVFKATNNRPRASREVDDDSPPTSLVKAWKAIGDMIDPANSELQKIGGPSVAAPIPITVQWSGCLERLWDMSDRADDLADKAEAVGQDGLWTRYREQVIKLAMLSAIARKPAVPEIEDADLDFADALVMHSCKYMEQFATSEIADSQFERDINDVLDFLRKAGGDGVSKKAMARGLRRLDSKRREQVLAHLVAGEGTVETIKGKNNSIIYKIAA